MKNVVEILKDAGIELTDDQSKDIQKEIAANYKTIAEYNKRIGQIEEERDQYKTQAEDAAKTLENIEGDPQELKAELEKWKKQAEESENTYKEALYKRDLSDAIGKELANYKFSSNAAKNAIESRILGAGLKMENGKVYGLKELIADIQKEDEGAFLSDEDGKKAQFTRGENGGGNPKKLTREDIMKIKDTAERQRAIADNIGLWTETE